MKKFFFAALVSILAIQCVSMEKSRRSSSGDYIPGKRVFEGRTEFLCEPIIERDIKNIQIVLNEYGRSGWVLASIIHRNGDPYAICLQRELL